MSSYRLATKRACFLPATHSLGRRVVILREFLHLCHGKERKNDRQDPVHLCVGNTPTAFLITWILRYTQNDHPLHRLRRSPAPIGAEYSPPSGPTKRGCVLWVIIGGGNHGVVGRVKMAENRFVQNAQSRAHRAIPQIKVVARKPRFFCNTFFYKNEKIFWRISAIF